MKKIYAYEAMFFGFKSFLKNPLFFIYTLIISKIILVCGLFLAGLFSFPYFINLIELGKKVFSQSKEFLEQVAWKRAIVVIKQFVAAFTDIKTTFAEVIESKYLLLLFLIGVIIFIACIKLFYDYVIFGWTKVSLGYYDKKHKSIELFFNSPMEWLKYILATFLFSIIFLIPTLVYFWGYLLFTYFAQIADKTAYIIYGFSLLLSLYFAFRLWFYPYFIINNQMNSVDALKSSYNLRYGFANILILFALYGTILALPAYYAYNTPGVLSFSIFGFVFAIIWVSCWQAYAYIFKKLTSQ